MSELISKKPSSEEFYSKLSGNAGEIVVDKLNKLEYVWISREEEVVAVRRVGWSGWFNRYGLGRWNAEHYHDAWYHFCAWLEEIDKRRMFVEKYGETEWDVSWRTRDV